MAKNFGLDTPWQPPPNAFALKSKPQALIFECRVLTVVFFIVSIHEITCYPVTKSQFMDFWVVQSTLSLRLKNLRFLLCLEVY